MDKPQWARVRVILYLGAALLGVGVAGLLGRGAEPTDARERRDPVISPNASHLFLASGEAVRFASIAALNSGEKTLVGIFSDGCVACSGQIDAFLGVARVGADSTTSVIVVLVTDSVGPIDHASAAREFGQGWNDSSVGFFRADRSMARSWGVLEYPALISLVRQPVMRQDFLGAGPAFPAALAKLGVR